MQDASLLKAAMREVQEETGLKNIAPLLDSEGTPILLDIDTHFIPRNLKKQEEEHYHHDFRYLFYSTKDDAGVANKQEVQSVTYIPITLLNDTLHTDKNLASKIYAYISDTHTLRRNYWHEILNYRDNCEVKFVCVSHIIPSSRAMIECLHENDLLL